jgi:hypothetical protein
VVWIDQSTGDTDIVGRRYDAFGNPAGGEVRGVNGFSGAGDQYSPDIAAVPGGGLAVASVDGFFGDNDIWVSIRTPTLALGRNDAIDIDDTLQTVDPAITVFANNSYAVAYTVNVAAGHVDVVGRIVSPTGTVGQEFPIFDDTDVSDNPELATLTTGNFVTVFQSEAGGVSASHDVFYGIFSPAGVPLFGPTSTPGASGVASERDPDVAALAGGSFVVVWTDSAGDASGDGIRAAVIDANGVPIRDNILVNVASQGGLQHAAGVTALADGGFFVTWTTSRPAWCAASASTPPATSSAPRW